jgi:hypothetical protein
LGYPTTTAAHAFRASDGLFSHAAVHAPPDYRVRGIRTDGFASTLQSLRALFPKVAIGHGLLQAMKKMPTTLPMISLALRQQLTARCAQICAEVQKRAGPRVLAVRQKLRCFSEQVGSVAGQAQRRRIRTWRAQKKHGGYAVLADRRRPRTTTAVDQAHTALDRQLVMMKGLHHPEGHHQAFLHGWAL